MRALLANKFAIPIYIVRFLRRNKTARSVLLNGAGLFVVVWLIAGPATTLRLLAMAFQLIFGFMFMIVQFVGIFLFMARSKTITVLPGDESALTLDDYKGQPVLVSTMKAWVRVLQGDRAFREMGGQPPSGILLHGAPGTGKTYLMKCLAGTAGIALHGIEGSSFRAMFWGVDVLKVLGFIGKARNMAMEHGACIAYIDEIDAIGQSRGGIAGNVGGQGQVAGPMGGMMGGSGALTTLLAQISGIGEERPMTTARNIARSWFGLPKLEEGYVMFAGGTNRPDVLDPALVRPGRLDKKIAVDPPDGPGRRDIFSYYIARVKHEKIDLDSLVSSTHGITPAAIETAVLKDAVRMAWMEGRKAITFRDIAAAVIEQHMGLPNPVADLPEDQRKQVAVHEAGHAVVSHVLRPDMRIAFVSTVRRGGALGFMYPVQKETTYALPLSRYVADIQVSLAGDVATRLVMGQRWTGAAVDLEHVRQRVLALAWHGVFGGLMLGLEPTKDQGEAIQRFVKEQWDATEDVLTRHLPAVKRLADALLIEHELDGVEATRIIENAEA